MKKGILTWLLVALFILISGIVIFELVFYLFLLPEKPSDSLVQKDIDTAVSRNGQTPTDEQQKTTTNMILQDVNSYLASKSRPAIQLKEVPQIENKILLEKIKSTNNLTLIDIRDDYELQFVQFGSYPFLYHVRFANIINNQLPKFDKSSEVVIISNTESRALIIANYLISLGYKDVKILKGGLVQWIKNRLPLKKSSTLLGLDSLLKFFSESEVKKLDKNIKKITFGPYSSGLINTQVMDSDSLSTYINTLDKTKYYLIECKTSYHCFDAVMFWSKANKVISIVGYTGFEGTIF